MKSDEDPMEELECRKLMKILKRGSPKKQRKHLIHLSEGGSEGYKNTTITKEGGTHEHCVTVFTSAVPLQ